MMLGGGGQILLRKNREKQDFGGNEVNKTTSTFWYFFSLNDTDAWPIYINQTCAVINLNCSDFFVIVHDSLKLQSTSQQINTIVLFNLMIIIIIIIQVINFMLAEEFVRIVSYWDLSPSQNYLDFHPIIASFSGYFRVKGLHRLNLFS